MLSAAGQLKLCTSPMKYSAHEVDPEHVNFANRKDQISLQGRFAAFCVDALQKCIDQYLEENDEAEVGWKDPEKGVNTLIFLFTFHSKTKPL